MRPEDQLAEYRRQMGADALRRQFLADGRNEHGYCSNCRAKAGQEHNHRCAFFNERKRAERVA